VRRDHDADLDALAALRREESTGAARVLGCANTVHFDFDDGELPDDDDVRGRIVRVIRELRPEVVLCPDPTAVFFGTSYFNHRDHRVTGWATLDAVAPAAGNPHYFPQHLVDGLAVHEVRAVYLSGTLEPNCWIDVEEVLERKIDAVFTHASQLSGTGDWFREFLRSSAEAAGTGAGLPYAEAFRRLDFL
jgi:LmbE family N-acetylglucosaminyl deacetylase